MTRISILQLVAIVSLFALFSSGCAGTATSRSTGETIDDVAISSKVKTALLTDSVTDGLDIEVEVFRGVVQLNGIADTGDEKARASRLAGNVAEVVRVENNLIVRSTRQADEYVDDKLLQTRVNAAFAKDEIVRAIGVDVEANRGTVLLGGFVDSEAVRNRAERIARGVDGVQHVHNNLSIK